MIAHMRDMTGEDVKRLEPRASGTFYRSLVAWAKIQPGAAYLVEAETGRELTYAHTLASVNSMRQLLGDTPRRIVDRKSTRLNSSHLVISYAVFCLQNKQ